MKRYLVILLACLFISACSGTIVTKHFKVIADPPDAVIWVVSGVGQHERKYASPAEITVEIPRDAGLAASASLMISRGNYKATVLRLRDIHDGDTLKVKLECDQCIPYQLDKKSYQLQYRLLAPVPVDRLKHQLTHHLLVTPHSDEVSFRDQTISLSFSVDEQAFLMTLINLSAYPLKILWERSEYTNVHGQRCRLMHSGIRHQDRNNPIPDQVVPSGGSVQEAITPVKHVYMSPQTGAYEIMPLFNHVGADGAGLKGKAFNLFIPIEINRTIIPYNFKIEISDAIKRTVKD